jgi:hypothetical protein
MGSVLKLVASVELPNVVFTSRARWMPLIVEWNASANMFYLLKNLLLLILVIFKLKCNNLIFNEIRVLNASYVCLHAFSLRRESPDPDPRRWTPHFWGGSVTLSTSHTHPWLGSKHKESGTHEKGCGCHDGFSFMPRMVTFRGKVLRVQIDEGELYKVWIGLVEPMRAGVWHE